MNKKFILGLIALAVIIIIGVSSLTNKTSSQEITTVQIDQAENDIDQQLNDLSDQDFKDFDVADLQYQ